MRSRTNRPLGHASSSGERLAMAVCLSAVGVMGFSATAPILPDLRDALDATEGGIGWVQSSIALPGIVMSVLIGYLADRYGRRPVALTSLLLFGAFGAAGYLARSLPLLIAFRLVQGIGLSGALGFGITLIGDFFDERRRTRTLGINQTGLEISAMATPVAAGILAGRGSAFSPFLLYLLAIPLAVWLTRLPDVAGMSAAPPVHHLREAQTLLRERRLLGAVATVFAATLVVVGFRAGVVLTVVPLFLEQELRVPVAARGWIIAAFQPGAALAGLMAGWIARRMATVATARAGLVVLAGGSLLLTSAGTPFGVAAGMVVCGAGFGIFIPVAQSWMSGLGGHAFRGLLVGVWVAVNRVAQTVSPPLGSGISELAEPRTALVVAAVLLVASTLASWPIHRLVLARHTA